MTTLTDKFDELDTRTAEREGMSLGSEDNKLAYLRLLAAIPFELLLEDIVLGVETLVSAAQLYLSLNLGSAVIDLSGETACSVIDATTSTYAYDGRTYVVWETIPYNTELVSGTGVVIPQRVKALPTTHWSGVKFVGQSNKPTFRLSDTDTRVYNSGQLYTISTTDDIEISASIEGEGSIILRLCTSVLNPVATCANYTSQVLAHGSSPGGSDFGSRSFAVFTDDVADTFPPGGGLYWALPCWYTAWETGMTIHWVSGSPRVNVAASPANHVEVLSAGNPVYTLMSDTIGFLIDEAGSGSGAFEVIICPAGVSP